MDENFDATSLFAVFDSLTFKKDEGAEESKSQDSQLILLHGKSLKLKSAKIYLTDQELDTLENNDSALLLWETTDDVVTVKFDGSDEELSVEAIVRDLQAAVNTRSIGILN